MPEVFLGMSEATERACAELHLRSRPGESERHDELQDVRFNVFSVDKYVAVGGHVVNADLYPVSVSLQMNPQTDGLLPLIRRSPWRPFEYVYRLARPTSRWVADNEVLEKRTDGSVIRWYDAFPGPNANNVLLEGLARHLISLETQLPMFAYTANGSWIDCDAVSMYPSSRFALQTSSLRSKAHGVMVLGTFDKSGGRPYSPIVFESHESSTSLTIDEKDQVVLMHDGLPMASLPSRYAPGRLTALGLFAYNDEAVIASLDIDGGKHVAKAPISPLFAITVGNVVVEPAVVSDIELAEIAYWRDAPEPARVILQMLGVLSYYKSRRPE